MPSTHYYLVASLPSLMFGSDLPFSTEEFIRECEKWLSEKDRHKVLSASLNYQAGPAGHEGLLEEWRRFNNEMRKELARIRAGNKTGARQHGVPEYLKNAIEAQDPLAVERSIERIRWDFIEDKQRGCYFDVNWLVFYFLKLQIMERLAGFNKDEGTTFFYNLCEVKNEHESR